MGKFSNKLITTNIAIRKRFEDINNIKYYRFSDKVDFIHLIKYNDTKTMCKRSLISINYAKFKPKGEICPSCKFEALKTKKENNEGQ